MAVLKPRERLVYFRVSEDEFSQFVSVCERAGARSISDLARSAVQRLIAEGKVHRESQDVDERLRILERLISAVTEQLQLLDGDHHAHHVASARVDAGVHPGVSNSGAADQQGQKE